MASPDRVDAKFTELLAGQVEPRIERTSWTTAPEPET
jgi:hypothetical protein